MGGKSGLPLKGMIIIWTNLAGLEPQMLYTKIQPESFLDYGEEDFFIVFTLYGHGGHFN